MSSTRERTVILAGAVVVLGLVVALIAWANRPTAPSLPRAAVSEATADPLDAKVACKDLVRERLVSPATADFQNVFEMSATQLESLEWVVYGYVDSQNRAGTLIRSAFKCHVRQRAVGADSWKAVEVQVGER